MARKLDIVRVKNGSEAIAMLASLKGQALIDIRWKGGSIKISPAEAAR